MIDYPIDLVFPYVNNASKKWQETYIKFCQENGYQQRLQNFNSERYRDWGLLRYVLRGIDHNMPFINNVFIILQDEDQIPEWMDTTNIKIVYHRDFIPEQYLPTYNSTTIEMFLDEIPGLLEHFIYSNDDIYALRPMTAEDFFSEDGRVKIGFRKRELKDYMQFNLVCCNCFDQVFLETRNKTAVPNYLTPYHEFMPMIKSHVTKIKELLGDRITKNITPFRDGGNHNQYIYPYYEYGTWNTMDPTRGYCYINMEDNFNDVVNIIAAAPTNTLVLNDNEKTNMEQWKDLTPVYRAFESVLFKMSKFEKRPRITVCIPMYNAEEYIGACLDSIPAREDLEVIIVNDCCTDKSDIIAQEKLPRFKKWAMLKMNRNAGVAICRNVLLDVANGDYIFFLDADDKVDTEAFNRVVDNELADQDILIPKYIRNDGFSGYPTILRGCFIKKSYVGSIRHDPNRRCFEDVDFKRRLREEKGELNETQSNEIVYLYNMPLVGSLTWQHYREMGVAAYSKGTDEWERWFKGRPR